MRAPNKPLQATGDSMRFRTIPEFLSCRPRLSCSVRSPHES